MIHLHTLGTVDLRRDGAEVRSVLAQPKRLALLVYLATASPRGFHSRDTLLGLFWPESDGERARNALRQALHYLRRSLGEDAVVGRGDREVGVDPAVLACDAAAFDAALEDGRPADALALYRGDFLRGFFLDDAPDAERWIDEERARRRRAAVEAASALARRDEEAGDPRAAAGWARKALSLEPHDEGALRRLLRLLEEAGEPAAALEAYAEFAARLQAEFGLTPGEETVRQVERLRARPAVAPSPPPATASSGDARPSIASSPPTPSAGSAATGSVDSVRSTETTPSTALTGSIASPSTESIGSTGSTGSPSTGSPSTGSIESTGARSIASPASPSSIDGSAERRVMAGAASSDDVVPAGAGGERKAGISGRGRWALAAAVVAALAFGGWRVMGGGAPETAVAAASDQASIAVLPFVNMSDDPAKEYFSDGITEELLNVLAGVSGLQVAARTSAFAFKGKNVPVDSIGRALRVAHVLEGSVRTSGDRVRITAQLINARTGYHLWSQTYDRELRDVFAVQDEISRAIVAALRVEMEDAGPRAARAETADPEAHALVLRGAHAIRQATRESLAQAAAFHEEAIRRDPKYARAFAGLANAYLWQAYYGHVPPETGFTRARATAEQALALDPGLADAHVVLGRVAHARADFTAAEDHYQRALAINPADARIYQRRAELLMRRGRHDEAIASARLAAELDPVSPGAYNDLAAVYAAADRYEEALKANEDALRFAPAHPVMLGNRALWLSELGRHDQAVRSVEEARAAAPGEGFVVGDGGVRLRPRRPPRAGRGRSGGVRRPPGGHAVRPGHHLGRAGRPRADAVVPGARHARGRPRAGRAPPRPLVRPLPRRPAHGAHPAPRRGDDEDEEVAPPVAKTDRADRGSLPRPLDSVLRPLRR